MTDKITYIDQAHMVENCSVFFDTNIWLLLEGVNGLSRKHRQDQYSKAYKTLIEKKNTVIVNEYVIAELCNRSVKLAYDFAKASSGQGEGFMRFKDFRETQEFNDALEVARDTSLNILDDCNFSSCHDKYFDIRQIVEEFAEGRMDFSDLIIRDHCKSEGFILMSDDGDYTNCGLHIITANKKLIK